MFGQINIPLADHKRTITITNGSKMNFPVGSIGINSYANDIEINVTADDEAVNLQIGNFTSIAYHVVALLNRNHDYQAISTSPLLGSKLGTDSVKIHQKGQVLIGNDVWIGNNVILLSGIKIGNGAVIGAGSVVSKDIPPYAIAAGNPIRIIGYRFPDEQIKRLLAIRWWDWDIDRIAKHREYFDADINVFTDRFYVEEQTPMLEIKRKSRAILLVPDLYDSYPVWPKVVKEHLRRFSNEDDVTLILRIAGDADFNNNLAKIKAIVPDSADTPDILILNDDLEDERSMFQNIDYFITTRNTETMRYMDYADAFGVPVLSGVDIPIFSF